MFVSDCDYGAHGGYAFLDGIGTTYNPPDPHYGSQPVPEPATMILMGAGLIGLIGSKRKRFFKETNHSYNSDGVIICLLLSLN